MKFFIKMCVIVVLSVIYGFFVVYGTGVILSHNDNSGLAIFGSLAWFTASMVLGTKLSDWAVGFIGE